MRILITAFLSVLALVLPGHAFVIREITEMEFHDVLLSWSDEVDKLEAWFDEMPEKEFQALSEENKQFVSNFLRLYQNLLSDDKENSVISQSYNYWGRFDDEKRLQGLAKISGAKRSRMKSRATLWRLHALITAPWNLINYGSAISMAKGNGKALFAHVYRHAMTDALGLYLEPAIGTELYYRRVMPLHPPVNRFMAGRDDWTDYLIWFAVKKPTGVRDLATPKEDRSSN